MKKTISLLAVICYFIIAQGQVIKLQGGPAISQLDWRIKGIDAEFYIQPFTAWSVLAGIDYLERKRFNLSGHLGMIIKGGKDEFPVRDDMGNHNGENVTFKAQLDYLTFNTCFDFKFLNEKKIVPFIGIGPRLDYLINHSKEFDVLESNNEMRKIAFGVLIGTGLNYKISKLQIGLRADYYHNFNNIAEWPAGDNRYGGEVSVRTVAVSLVLGWRIKNEE